jgi:hypothetical protein
MMVPAEAGFGVSATSRRPDRKRRKPTHAAVGLNDPLFVVGLDLVDLTIVEGVA